MARRRSKDHRISVRELVDQQRGALYATGHQNVNMSLPQNVIERIDFLKARYGLRSRDAVVARIIAKSKTTIDPDHFVQRVADVDTVFRRISPIVPGELAIYMKQIQQRFRNLAYGPVFEMIFAEVGNDLSIPDGRPEPARQATTL